MRSPTSGSQGSTRLSHATAVLTSPEFVAAVALLLLNDWVLKAAVGNWLTGKLSDVAGLAAFSMFWSAVLPPRRGPAGFIVTAALFVLWKSPLSEPALRAWNALGVWPLARVVDYSDWLALGALLPAYRLVRRMGETPSASPNRLLRRVGALAAAGVALVAFSATSILRLTPVEGVDYTIAAAPEEVLAGLGAIGVPKVDRPKKHRLGGADTVELHIRQPPERWVTVTVEVSEAEIGESRIRLVGMLPHGPEPSVESLRRAFLAQVVQPLEEWLDEHRADEP